MTINYKVFGPFEIARNEHRQINKKQDSLWNEAERTKNGLSEGKGVYIFGVGGSGGAKIRPWYVGATNAQNFFQECFTDHKLNYYKEADAVLKFKSKAYLFLVLRLTPEGRIYRGKGVKDIEKLEDYFISLAIRQNPKLKNVKETGFWKEAVIPGILNSTKGPPGSSVSRLKLTMGL